jgi:hypothetical protein
MSDVHRMRWCAWNDHVSMPPYCLPSFLLRLPWGMHSAFSFLIRSPEVMSHSQHLLLLHLDHIHDNVKYHHYHLFKFDIFNTCCSVSDFSSCVRISVGSIISAMPAMFCVDFSRDAHLLQRWFSFPSPCLHVLSRSTYLVAFNFGNCWCNIFVTNAARRERCILESLVKSYILFIFVDLVYKIIGLSCASTYIFSTWFMLSPSIWNAFLPCEKSCKMANFQVCCSCHLEHNKCRLSSFNEAQYWLNVYHISHCSAAWTG